MLFYNKFFYCPASSSYSTFYINAYRKKQQIPIL
jgi:hypothetical protein